MSGIAAFFGSVGVTVGCVFVLTLWINRLLNAVWDMQCQLDDLKRELEEMQRKE